MVLSLGDRLREARAKKGYKQTEVCRTLGITSARLSGYERGIRKPDHVLLNHLAELYGVTVDYLVSGKIAPGSSLNVRELLESKHLHWDGVPLSEEEMAPIRSLLEIVMRDRVPHFLDNDKQDATPPKTG